MLCLLLILNFAKRIAEHIGVRRHSITGDNKRVSVEVSKRGFVFSKVNNDTSVISLPKLITTKVKN